MRAAEVVVLAAVLSLVLGLQANRVCTKGCVAANNCGCNCLPRQLPKSIRAKETQCRTWQIVGLPQRQRRLQRNSSTRLALQAVEVLQ